MQPASSPARSPGAYPRNGHGDHNLGFGPVVRARLAHGRGVADVEQEHGSEAPVADAIRALLGAVSLILYGTLKKKAWSTP